MKKNEARISQLFDIDKTIAKDLLKKYEYPWEILENLGAFIQELGATLSKNEYNFIEPNIWIHKSVKIPNTVSLAGPLIVCEDAELRHCLYVRGKVIIGKKSVAGNSCELKNCLIFDEVQIPHYNYIGDSILGYKSHMGASSLTSNVKSDKTLVSIKFDDEISFTGLKKLGAMIGDYVEVGAGSVLNPGSVIGKNSNIYPLSSFRGTLSKNNIYKNKSEVVEKHD